MFFAEQRHSLYFADEKFTILQDEEEAQKIKKTNPCFLITIDRILCVFAFLGH